MALFHCGSLAAREVFAGSRVAGRVARHRRDERGVMGALDAVLGVAAAHGDEIVVQPRLLIGMGERTTPQAVGQLARNLFAKQGAERVIACLIHHVA